MKAMTSIRRAAISLIVLGSLFLLPHSALARPVLIIDPGHGGKDPGAVGRGIQEKNTNLAISRQVAKEARRQGWRVQMTRNNDRFIPLPNRPAVANRQRGSVFVSIHSNSAGSRPLGNMTIYRSPSGKRLGYDIMKQLGKQAPYGNIGNRSDVRGLAVLRKSARPAVIVENLSVTSPRESARLKSPSQQANIARAIVRGIANYDNVRYKPLPVPKKHVSKPKHASKPEKRKVSSLHAPVGQLAQRPRVPFWFLPSAAGLAQSLFDLLG